jgi:hypothetical protein
MITICGDVRSLVAIKDVVDKHGKLTMPDVMPPEPTPAIARPRMNAIEFGAAPQMAEPASKRTIDPRKTALMEKTWYSFPNTSWKAHMVSK